MLYLSGSPLFFSTSWQSLKASESYTKKAFDRNNEVIIIIIIIIIIITIITLQ